MYRPRMKGVRREARARSWIGKRMRAVRREGVGILGNKVGMDQVLGKTGAFLLELMLWMQTEEKAGPAERRSIYMDREMTSFRMLRTCPDGMALRRTTRSSVTKKHI